MICFFLLHLCLEVCDLLCQGGIVACCLFQIVKLLLVIGYRCLKLFLFLIKLIIRLLLYITIQLLSGFLCRFLRKGSVDSQRFKLLLCHRVLLSGSLVPIPGIKITRIAACYEHYLVVLAQITLLCSVYS